MKLLYLVPLALVAAAASANPEIYKWVDEEGNVHYSDCPPPPECTAELIEAMPGPAEADVQRAQQRLEALLTDQEENRALRERERLEKERQQVEAMQLAVERKRICIFAQQNLHALLMQRPVYYIDAKGERVYLDDATHKAEIARMSQLIKDNCTQQ